MGGEVAHAPAPLDAGIGGRLAVSPGGKLDDAGAPFARLDDRVAAAAVEVTSLLGHKHAGRSRFDGCTVHG